MIWHSDEETELCDSLQLSLIAKDPNQSLPSRQIEFSLRSMFLFFCAALVYAELLRGIIKLSEVESF